MTQKHKHKKMHKRKHVNVFGSKLQFFIRFVSWFLLITVTLAVIALKFQYWLLDIYVSYIPQIFFFAVSLYLVLVALYGRFIIRDGWQACWRSIGKKEAAMFVFSTIFTVYIAAYSLLIIEPVPQNSIAHNLTVGTYNALYTNPEIYKASYFFESKATDIIALQEISPNAAAEAQEILGFEYMEISQCGCSAKDTEVAILSKYPLKNTQMVVESENGGILRSEAVIDGDTTLAVYAVHIPPPFNQEWYNLRNQFKQQLSESINEDLLKVVVMGDFNTTIFSPSMQSFIDQTSSRIDHMSETSWPQCSWYGYGDVACARIDHIFASRQFGVGNRYMGEGFGSDHRPVAVQLLVN